MGWSIFNRKIRGRNPKSEKQHSNHNNSGLNLQRNRAFFRMFMTEINDLECFRMIIKQKWFRMFMMEFNMSVIWIGNRFFVSVSCICISPKWLYLFIISLYFRFGKVSNTRLSKLFRSVHEIKFVFRSCIFAQ